MRPVDLATLWRESDAISLHCPLTPDNRDLVNAQTLRACKRGVILVNTARGGLIDEAALLEAVRSGPGRRRRPGQLRGGADDGAAPVPGEPNIILSPHIGGVTGDAYVNMGVAAARNMLAVLGASEERAS